MKRRQFLAGGVGGFLGFAARNQLAHAWLRETPRIKRCVVLWMNGGPSQFETFDPKPGTRTGGDCNSSTGRHSV